ncbi:unnamed protein product [Plutella xylostella]|uniref:(diamondback moth) hypothetical protein n=1 Tax=Plutella xylostella TaxID=51655 RepID=A0A8S4EX84_PLUXY|nr:unnamed protein product [Plutella xylostella]
MPVKTPTSTYWIYFLPPSISALAVHHSSQPMKASKRWEILFLVSVHSGQPIKPEMRNRGSPRHRKPAVSHCLNLCVVRRRGQMALVWRAERGPLPAPSHSVDYSLTEVSFVLHDLSWTADGPPTGHHSQGRGEHERGERGTDTGTNSFTLLRARSFYRQFVVTKRSVEIPGSAKMPDPG